MQTMTGKTIHICGIHRIIYLLVLVLVFSIITSCVTQSKVEYLQDKNKSIKAFREAELTDYLLKPHDELFVQISSLDDLTANIFQSTGNQRSGIYATSTPYSASLNSYTVDREGYIQLPVIGNILVRNKTISQVSLILRDSLSHILHEPVVTMKLVNRYVSVLGEVRSPGHFPYSQEKISILDALGLAGDITDYGDRNKVILIRNENNENIRINLNLTNSEILSSDNYIIHPNDIIYVKPLRNKFWGMRQFPFSVVFSTITTGLLIYNIFK